MRRGPSTHAVKAGAVPVPLFSRAFLVVEPSSYRKNIIFQQIPQFTPIHCRHLAVNACLMPLCAVDGCAIITVRLNFATFVSLILFLSAFEPLGGGPGQC
jgi:hypothetical protein